MVFQVEMMDSIMRLSLMHPKTRQRASLLTLFFLYGFLIVGIVNANFAKCSSLRQFGLCQNSGLAALKFL